MNHLLNLERDIISYNHQWGAMQSFIRENGQIPVETLEIISKHNYPQDLIELSTVDVDEHLKQLKCLLTRKNGEEVEIICYVPTHDDLAKNNALDIHILDPNFQ
jgi:hypothetical protein